MISDSFLSEAGSLFLVAWSVIVAVVAVAAFGRDLLPIRQQVDSPAADASRISAAGR